VTEASARIIAAVRTHSLCGVEPCCATTVDNSGVYVCGVYVCYLKGTVFVYFRWLARTVGFSGTHLYL